MTGLRKYAKNAWRFTPLASACVAGLALLALIPGCPPVNQNPSVSLDCGGGDALLGEVVSVSADLSNATGTIAITASGGATVNDAGDGSATVSANAEGTVTVTATATLSDGSTLTDTCEIAFAGAGASVDSESGSGDVNAGGTTNLSVDLSALGAGGGEGDDFTITWSVDPSTAGSFDCGDADQDAADDNDTDCASIAFTAADPCADATVTVLVTRNSDDRVFSATFAINCIECEIDADCDDGDLCTTDSCAAGECSNTAVTCDDGVFCNGTESCDPATGECVTTANCEDGQVCDEDTDTCGGCTDDAACDDGDFCTGTETCVDGACVSSGDPCTDGTVCNEDTDSCDPPAVCESDDQCDDGNACNGAETCDPENADAGADGCVAGEDPCADLDCGDDTPECTDNGDGTVSCACPEVPAVVFTLGQDTLTGTSGNDTFSAPLLVPTGSGTQFASLQTGDSANGLGGDDTLGAFFPDTAANVTVVSTITAIEQINITSFDPDHTVTLAGANISGATGIASLNSVGNVTVDNLAADVAATLSGLTGNDTLSLQFATGASTNPFTGSSDVLSLTVNNCTAGTYSFTTATNGYESAEIESTGTVNNVLSSLTAAGGGSTGLASLTVTGTASLEIDAAPATILTVTGSGSTGGLQLGSGLDAATYAEAWNPTTNWTQLTGTSGNDTIIFEDILTTTDFSTGTIDLGEGTDVVQNEFSATFAGASKVRNTEEARFNATAAAAYNFSGWTGLTTVTVEEDGASTAFSLNNIAAVSGSTLPTLNFRGDNSTGANQTFDTITYGAGTTSGTQDLTINVANRGTRLNTGTATTFSMTTGAITAAGIENIDITCADGPVVIGGITASALVTLDVTAATSNTGTNVTLGTVTTGSGTTITTVNASGVTGNFSATVDYLANNSTITLGDGNDTFTVGTNSAATASMSATLGNGNNTYTGDTSTSTGDTVTGGTGNDTIIAGPGADTLTTGTGSDTVNMDTTDFDERVIDTVVDFDVNNDKITFDLSSLNGITGVDDMQDFDAADNTAGTAFTIARQTADAFDPGAVDLVMIDKDFKTYANAAAARADRAAWTIVLSADNFDDNEGLLIGYGDGSGNTRFMVIMSNAADEDNTDNYDDFFDILILSGVDPDLITNSNFNNWQ